MRVEHIAAHEVTLPSALVFVCVHRLFNCQLMVYKPRSAVLVSRDLRLKRSSVYSAVHVMKSATYRRVRALGLSWFSHIHD